MQRPSRSQRQQQQQSEHRQQAGLTEATVATDAIGGTGGEAAGRNLWAAADGRGDGSSAGFPSDDEEALGMQTAEPDFYDPNADDEVRRCSARQLQRRAAVSMRAAVCLCAQTVTAHQTCAIKIGAAAKRLPRAS